jgi:eukaryotic-like serine/threonine-protein kinase
VRPVAATSFDEKGISVSPDGKWLAYVSNETGIDEVYIRHLAEASARWPVSTGGGREPRWIRTGELFYRKNDSVMVARVEVNSEPRVGPSRLLFTGRYASTGFEPLWDVSPDGSRFALVRTNTVAEAPIGIVFNWLDHWRSKHQ